jgi:HAD superfamily hydrolase (TIGR01509 family)
MIKGIVFDMDGLMFDTERIAMDGWDYAARKLGLVIPREIQIKTLGLTEESTKQIFEDYMGNSFDFDKAEELRIEYVYSFIEKNGVPLKKGLFELLDYLRANKYSTAVATSTEEEKAVYLLKKAGVYGYFDVVVCGNMIEKGKPKPDIYLKAGELLGISPSDCLALEDSINGILSASRAGMKPVMIPDMVRPDKETEKLLYARLSSLPDVIGLLEDSQ